MDNQKKNRAMILACIGTLIGMFGAALILMAAIAFFIRPSDLSWLKLVILGAALLWGWRKLTRPLIAFYKSPQVKP